VALHELARQPVSPEILTYRLVAVVVLAAISQVYLQ
jgi:hypothetical protein